MRALRRSQCKAAMPGVEQIGPDVRGIGRQRAAIVLVGYVVIARVERCLPYERKSSYIRWIAGQRSHQILPCFDV